MCHIIAETMMSVNISAKKNMIYVSINLPNKGYCTGYESLKQQGCLQSAKKLYAGAQKQKITLKDTSQSAQTLKKVKNKAI